MQTIVVEWFKRLIGYGAVAASGYVGTKVGDPELAGWVASGVAIVGGIVLNKAIPYVIPTRKKIDRVAGNLRR